MDFSTLFKHETDTVSFAAGSSILQRGTVSEVMYVVLEGEAEIRLGGDVVELARTGAILGELALIDHGPGSADVVARTDCRLAKIDARRFQFLIQQTPHFALDVMKVIADRLRAMNARLAATTG